MCGILFALTAHDYAPESSELDPIAARGRPLSVTFHRVLITISTGPDSLRTETRTVPVDDHQLQLIFVSSVLALRGDHVAAQPLVDERTGNILCWNGQVRCYPPLLSISCSDAGSS